MKQYAQTINLKNDPAIIERYIECHRNVWPEVERGLGGIWIHRMLIWRLGRQMFMFMETVDDFDTALDFSRYAASDPPILEWHQPIAPFPDAVPEPTPTDCAA